MKSKFKALAAMGKKKAKKPKGKAKKAAPVVKAAKKSKGPKKAKSANVNSAGKGKRGRGAGARQDAIRRAKAGMIATRVVNGRKTKMLVLKPGFVERTWKGSTLGRLTKGIFRKGAGKGGKPIAHWVANSKYEGKGKNGKRSRFVNSKEKRKATGAEKTQSKKHRDKADRVVGKKKKAKKAKKAKGKGMKRETE